jgi:biopolymer transport protein ExbB
MRWLRLLTVLCCMVEGWFALGAEPDPLAKAAERATTDFSARLEAATKELSAIRERIAREKAPLLKDSQNAEDQIIALGPDIAELHATIADAETRKKQLQTDRFNLQKNLTYLNTLARDSLKAVSDGLLPGEPPQTADRLATIAAQLEKTGEQTGPIAAVDTVELMLQRFRTQLGGYSAIGGSLVDEGNKLVPGTFVFVGPEIFFRSQDGKISGTVRRREGTSYPITYSLPAWDASRSEAFFRGSTGTILADASGGKALRLRETTGTVFQHIDRGGPVAYILIGVGLFALGIAVQKLFELRRLEVDEPAHMHRVIERLFDESAEEQRETIAKLKGTSRDLFATGIRHLKKPKEALEEHLFAFTLRTRLHYERRLPLLTVIATASPLLGLLGTVMGMIKTFALITVFGTGNAAKLSSGISEVLVTTELGLTVAIPTLIAHGFLSHRTQKKLSLLERYAVEFVAAASEVRGEEAAGERLASL